MRGQLSFIDTHCHLHDPTFYPDSREEPYRLAREANVVMVCVGTDETSSRQAVDFVRNHQGCYAVIGIHPHDAATNSVAHIRSLLETGEPVVGVGEIGLDYFYMNSPRTAQIAAFEAQLQMARDYHLPVSFHVRESQRPEEHSVWDDFWPIFDNFSGMRGVLHSFTDTQLQCERGLERGLLIGVNGISTFKLKPWQDDFFAWLPLESTVLETDAPFLTPTPFRGKMNMPSFVGRVAETMAVRKNVALSLVSEVTTANAKRLFAI
jgi:TatD DNase family protein